MDVERITGEIEHLERMFDVPDIRPLDPCDISAANRRHDASPQSMVSAVAAIWPVLPN